MLLVRAVSSPIGLAGWVVAVAVDVWGLGCGGFGVDVGGELSDCVSGVVCGDAVEGGDDLAANRGD